MSTGTRIRTIRENLVFENNWFRLFDDEVEFPDGSTGTYIFKEWVAPFGVAFVVTHGSEALVVENQRYRDEMPSMEVPQGFGELGETPQAGALRELYEETGMVETNLTLIRPLIAVGQSYQTHVFHANANSKQATLTARESWEVLGDTHWIDLKHFDGEKARECGIYDPLTLACLLMVKANIASD